MDYYDNSSIERTNQYDGDGNLVLAIRGGAKYYAMKTPITGGDPVLCNVVDLQNPLLHCYIGKKQ